VVSLIAQWLMCRKIIETWSLWFFVDACYVGMHYLKGIPMHALVSCIYLGMAIVGYLLWQKQLKVSTEHHELAVTI